jgi:predicted RNA binding protein YcfA (HicA-like mRNA interferase family)
MSPRLPNVSPREVVSAFAQAGFEAAGHKGSHIRLVNASGIQLVIPYHLKDLKRPLLKSLIKKARLTEEEFRKLL